MGTGREFGQRVGDLADARSTGRDWARKGPQASPERTRAGGGAGALEEPERVRGGAGPGRSAGRTRTGGGAASAGGAGTRAARSQAGRESGEPAQRPRNGAATAGSGPAVLQLPPVPGAPGGAGAGLLSPGRGDGGQGWRAPSPAVAGVPGVRTSDDGCPEDQALLMLLLHNAVLRFFLFLLGGCKIRRNQG